MIGYVTLGSNDFERSLSFYDAVLAVLDVERTFSNDHLQGYGGPGEGPMLAIATPFDGKAATAGNGTMVALVAPTRDRVDAVHRAALAAGGADEGAPGLRGKAFYAAYFRDPDGNKLCAYHRG
jgi:catechol 2,3-dioxygenase-like lactoylglutathione lyase family enzyme